MATVDVVLTMGQSNMSGVGNGNQAPQTDPALCWEWDGGPGLVQVDDPESCTTSPYKAQTGSLLPAFCNEYTAWSGRPVVVVRSAAGGTALLASNGTGGNGDWSETGTRFGAAVGRFLDAVTDVQTLGHTVGRAFALWSQGHKDATGGHDLNQYQAATSALVPRLRTALSVPDFKVYIELLSSTGPNTSTPPAQPNWEQVRTAQTNACIETDGLDMAFQDDINYYNYGWLKFDQVHYNQTGLNNAGPAFAQYVATDQGLQPPVDPPPVVEPPPASLPGRLLMVVT